MRSTRDALPQRPICRIGQGPWPTRRGRKRRHTLADHRFGADLAHVHDGDADHDHDDFVDGPIEDNPLWIADNVTLTSVGIDIGSAGTQVIFSKVHLRRLGEDLTSRYYVVGARDAVPLAGRADALPERGAHRRRARCAPSSTRPIAAAGLDAGRHRHRRGDPHRRGAAARERAGDRRPAGGARRRFRLRHRRPSHGGDARGLRLRRGARVVRPEASASSTSTSAAAPPSSR